MTIAVVDDEKNIRLSLQTALQKEGFTVLTFADGAKAFEAYKSQATKPDLFILDIMMPVMDGLTLLKTLRQNSCTSPIMFLTSRDEEFDRVLGLELGADDYLCKPFSLRELIARVHVILRRYSKSQSVSVNGGALLQKHEIELDTNAYSARYKGKTLTLTVTEFRLLETFMRNANTVLTRDQLISAAYPDDTYLNDRAIDCHIKRLRKKIGTDVIETVYGMGYRFKGE